MYHRASRWDMRNTHAVQHKAMLSSTMAAKRQIPLARPVDPSAARYNRICWTTRIPLACPVDCSVSNFDRYITMPQFKNQDTSHN